ncbi:hypothetical protein J0A67_19510 [Algoriphagus aestuariicola]|uniref:Uncharacterized protein n=1 Tax=Algoriphagus aestuariicola TaxID=1852016 RepID=A0ABS3BW09_9BACT|nr:hypothetical protein [Algoriphagus aestuariicola]MBN7803071.1 hypothetical protein [Algoriphagus aestuariicola]
MTKLLTLKHWQLFGLLVGFPLIFQTILFAMVFSGNYSSVFPYLISIDAIAFMGVFFGWFYQLGTHLHEKLPDTASMNVTRFKIFLFIPVIYLLFSVAIMPSLIPEGQTGLAIFALIIPLHLFSMFCLFYCLYFNAKALKTVEVQRPVAFGEYAGEFFLIWFFPIGIWIIQLRINKLFDATPENSTQLQ